MFSGSEKCIGSALNTTKFHVNEAQVHWMMCILNYTHHTLKRIMSFATKKTMTKSCQWLYEWL
jgi:hypothetical protein